MSLIQSLQWRYAAKKLNGEKVPQEKVDTILEAIQLSASSFGLQPYTVLVITDKAVKEKLLAASYNQSQIVDSSHLIVFAAWTKVTPAQIETFIADVASKRGLPLEALNDYKNYVLSSVGRFTDEQIAIWTAKQTYIALGSALAAAGELHVDATPMEGFVPAQYNEILGLNELGLSATLVLPLGYRDTTDWLAPLAKVRRDKELLFKFI